MEEKERISWFIRALKPEIKFVVLTKNPRYINDAYQYAMAEEIIFHEDKALRARQRVRRKDSNEPGRE